MRKIVLAVMIVSFSLVGYAPCFARVDTAKSQRAICARRCITKWDMFKFMINLDITAEQKTAFKELATAMDNATQAITADIEELHDQMTDTFLAAEIDTAAAEVQISSLLALQNDVADILLHGQLEAAQILTGTQRTMILEMVNKIRQCAAGHAWKSMSKPFYFSLIMPEQTF